MSLGTELAADALELLNEFGQTVTYTRVVTGDYVPSTGSAVDTSAPFTLKALIEELRNEGQNDALSALSTQKMTAAASSFSLPPSNDDKVQTSTEGYIVQNYSSVCVGDDIVLYTFELRRG